MQENQLKFIVPEKIYTGLLSDTFKKLGDSDPRVITFKRRNTGWFEQKNFERLTGGYKPGRQADPEKQLTKTICNTIEEFDNIPVEGFEVVNTSRWLYSNKLPCGIVIRDPRGFTFSISERSFLDMFSNKPFSIIDSKINGKFAYAWNKQRRMILVSEQSEIYTKYAACTKNLMLAKKLKPKDLKPGDVYHFDCNSWVYCGNADTYSVACHINALVSGQYDIDTFMNEEKHRASYSHVTCYGMHIFVSYDDALKGDFLHVRMRRGVSGIEKDEKPAVMIPETWQTRLAFNKIDLKNIEFEDMDFETFKQIFGSRHSWCNDLPDPNDSCFDYAYSLYISRENGVNIQSGNQSVYVRTSTPYGFTAKPGYISWIINGKPYLTGTLEDAFKTIKPKIPLYKFENGEKIHPTIAIGLFNASHKTV